MSALVTYGSSDDEEMPSVSKQISSLPHKPNFDNIGTGITAAPDISLEVS